MSVFFLIFFRLGGCYGLMKHYLFIYVFNALNLDFILHLEAQEYETIYCLPNMACIPIPQKL